jgi:general secretion pathway protein F
MTSFRYKAVSAGGETVEGAMEAPDRSAVVEILRSQGHFPLKVEEGRANSESILHRDLFGGSGGRVAQRDIAIATRELATLLKAGLPLDRALRVLIDVADVAAVRAMHSRILERVQGGGSLADAIDDEGSSFPSFYAGMVHAGEAGGSLQNVLVRLADFMERIQALRESVRSALIYPAILMTMATITVIVMFGLVLPQFRPMFEEMGDALPLLTRIFLIVGDAVQEWWWAGALVLVLAVLLFRRALRGSAFRLRWDTWKLGIPLAGDLLRKIETARFAHTMSMLLQGGQPLLDSLGIVRNVVGNSALAHALAGITERLRQGQGLATPLAECGLFPSLAVHLIRVGEEGGQLEAMLEQIAITYDREVQDATKRLMALLVPLLTIGLGGVIAIIIASVLGAFLSVNEIVY